MASIPHPLALVVDQSNRLTKEYYDYLRSLNENQAPVIPPEIPSTFFDIRSDVQSTTVNTDSDVIFVAGYRTRGDGGGGFFVRVAAEPSHAAKLQDLAGAWFELISRPLTPEHFGARGNGSTDDEDAFSDLCSTVRTLGGGAVELGVGKTYSLMHSPAVGTSVLMDFTGCSGLRFNSNGSQLVFPATFTGGRVIQIVHLEDCYDVELNGLHAEQTTTLAPDTVNGLMGVIVADTNQAIRVNGYYQAHGRSTFECVRSSELAVDDRARGIFINEMTADRVYYGATFQKNGDQVKVDGLKGMNNARVFFAYNVHELDAIIEGSPGSNTANDALIGVYADPAESPRSNTLSDCSVRYLSRSQAVQVSSFIGGFIAQGTASSGSGTIRNLKIEFDIEISAPFATSTAFEMYKINVVADSTLRNHVINGLTVTGNLKSFGNNVDPIRWGQFGSWNGEVIRNLDFRDITVTGTGTGAFRIDGGGLESLGFENVRVPSHNLTMANVAKGTLQVGKNVSFANFKSDGASGSVEYERFGSRIRQWGKVTCANGVANTDFDLPATLLNTTDSYALASNRSTGNADFSITLQDTNTVRITRASTAGDDDMDFQVTGYMGATGSPI